MLHALRDIDCLIDFELDSIMDYSPQYHNGYFQQLPGNVQIEENAMSYLQAQGYSQPFPPLSNTVVSSNNNIMHNPIATATAGGATEEQMQGHVHMLQKVQPLSALLLNHLNRHLPSCRSNIQG